MFDGGRRRDQGPRLIGSGRKLAGSVAALGVVGMLAACSAAEGTALVGTVEYTTVALDEASAVPGVVAATDEFGLAMIASGPPGENVVTSPASAVIALGMLAEGAAGSTADAFDDALGASGRDRTDALNALVAALDEHAGEPKAATGDTLPKHPLVHVANHAVVDDDAAVRQSYLDLLSGSYDAGVTQTDLGAPDAGKILDAWVKENTGGLIERSAITPDSNTRLVLQNATLFAAAWLSPFDEFSVRPTPFTLADGSEAEAESMGEIRQVQYAESEGWALIRLPYATDSAGGTPFAAEVVLPPEGTDPATLTGDRLGQLRSTLQERDVEVRMPTVDLDAATLDLGPVLEAQGLGELFTAPDLSGISEVPLSLTAAVQQAVLQVDAEGTVAAAVTEFEVGAMAPQLPDDLVEFTVDRPYLFSVLHTDTSWSLFTAAIRDPRH